MVIRKTVLTAVFGVFALSALLAIPEVAGARNRELLDKALADSNNERAGVEREYKRNGAVARKGEDRNEVRAISVEIGDELGSPKGAKDGFKESRKSRVFRESGVSAKLDKEWKEVNQALEEHTVRAGSSQPQKEHKKKHKKVRKH